jgi:hypothetical protein
VGVRLVAATVGALVLTGAVPAATAPLPAATAFLVGSQRADGGFGESGGAEDASLTAWAALALVAGGASADARERALAYLRSYEADVQQVTDIALVSLARSALGDRPDGLLARLTTVAPGGAVNAEIWTILALRAAGEPAPAPLVRDVLAAQAGAGGWSWTRGVQPDSNDTAAALEALRAAGVSGKPIARGLRALRRFQNADGGYGLAPGRASDAQSTAWAIQALFASGARPARATWRFLARLRRPDGSYRYSARYKTTPVWVTAQVAPALAGRPFPLSAG